MAEFLKKLRRGEESGALFLLRAVLYAVMLALICVYFEGGGEFIYEAF